MNKYLLSLMVAGSVALCSHAAEGTEGNDQAALQAQVARLQQQLARERAETARMRAKKEKREATTRMTETQGDGIQNPLSQEHLAFCVASWGLNHCFVELRLANGTPTGEGWLTVREEENGTYSGFRGNRKMSPEEAKAAFKKYYGNILTAHE